MKLYGFAPSPNTWQVRALATHIGVPLEFVPLDFTKGDTKTPAFLAINPTGRTPALVDGDFKLWETMAIMQYVAGKKANPLWPDDARARADIARWQSWNLAHWTRDAWAPVLSERLVKNDAQSRARRRGRHRQRRRGVRQRSRDARRASRQAKISGWRHAHDRRLRRRLRRCSTPRKRSCRLRPTRRSARLVRARHGAAVLDCDRAAIRRGGVNTASLRRAYDEAIERGNAEQDCFAPLAMTTVRA